MAASFDGEDDLLGDLAGQLVQTSSNRASKPGKVGRGRGIVSRVTGTSSNSAYPASGAAGYPLLSLSNASKPRAGQARRVRG